MTNPLKKIYLAVPSMFIAVTSQVNAADSDSSPIYEPPIYIEQNYEPSCCEPSCCDVQCCDPSNCYFPKSGLNIRGELLYWRAELCGLESAFGDTTIATTIDGDIITTTVTETHKEPHSKWNTGFRVGGDWAFCSFDLDAVWTHYRGSAKFHDDEQQGRWKIKYNVVDVTLGRYFCMTPCFYFKPFIGVRGAWINQSLTSHSQTLFTALIGDNTVFTDMNDTERFRGVGPLLGIEADWCLGCNFSLYGSVGIVTYYGNVKSRNFDVDTFTRTVSACNGSKHRCFSSIGTDLAIGLRWDKTWCCSCYAFNFMLKVGAEQHRIYDFSNLGSDGTLSLDGGVFAAGIGFSF